MGIELSKINLNSVNLNPSVQLNNNRQKVNFLGLQNQDTFQNNSVQKRYSEAEVRTLINKNPEIKRILDAYKLPLNINISELNNLIENHSKDVSDNAVAIAKNLPASLKANVNLKNLKDAAILHDFGKVLIPVEILNKTTSLTEKEREIINLHSELGYQLLKNTGLNNETLNLVRHHHDNKSPDKSYIPDINLQILNLADKYSALTEERVYKGKFTPQQALTILYKEVQSGEIHPFIFNALVKTVSEQIPERNIKNCNIN